MFCTEKQRKDCRVEKMGCEGCYYYNDLNNIEKVMFPIKEENLLKDGDKVTEQGIIRKEIKQNKIMNEEEIKAIEYINKILKYSKLYAHTGRKSDFLRDIDKKQIETVLNLIIKQQAKIDELNFNKDILTDTVNKQLEGIEKQKAEIEKKDKIQKEVAEEIDNVAVELSKLTDNIFIVNQAMKLQKIAEEKLDKFYIDID